MSKRCGNLSDVSCEEDDIDQWTRFKGRPFLLVAILSRSGRIYHRFMLPFDLQVTQIVLRYGNKMHS